MKLTSDSGCRMPSTKSAQLSYGRSAELLVSAKNSRRAAFSDGTPVSRPRAMLIAARSSGRPTRLLRSASVTNSSISLPTWRVMPRTIGAGRLLGVIAPSVGEGERVEEGRR